MSCIDRSMLETSDIISFCLSMSAWSSIIFSFSWLESMPPLAADDDFDVPEDDALEDVHMNIEARLVEKIGDAGKTAAHGLCMGPQQFGVDANPDSKH